MFTIRKGSQKTWNQWKNELLVGVFANREVEENKQCLLWKYLLFERYCPVQILKRLLVTVMRTPGLYL